MHRKLTVYCKGESKAAASNFVALAFFSGVCGCLCTLAELNIQPAAQPHTKIIYGSFSLAESSTDFPRSFV